MRARPALAALVAAAVAVSSAPAPAFAQFARAAAVSAATPGSPVVPVAPSALSPSLAGLSAAPALTPSLVSPLLPRLNAVAAPVVASPAQAVSATPAPAPASAAAAPISLPERVLAAPAPAAAASAEAVPVRLERLSKAAARDLAELPKTDGASARAGAQAGFDRLLGYADTGRSGVAEPVRPADVTAQFRPLLGRARAAAAPKEAEPLPPSSVRRPEVRGYLAATAAFKIGMESLGLAVPLIALTVYGSAAWAAAMAMGWGLSQILGSSLGGGLLDRRSPSTIIARAMVAQAVVVALMATLFAVQGATGIPLAPPAVLLALHVLSGIGSGVADTARQVIPPTLVGSDGQDLKQFNAKVHIAYESAGVVGALLTGLVIKSFGVVPALILHPPAYLLSAWIFAHFSIPAAAHAESGHGPGFKAAVRRAWNDFVTGVRAVRGSPLVFWAAVALVIPLTLHRLLEGLLIPVAAKSIFNNPAMAAWILGASNVGELSGASTLLKLNMSEEEAGARLHSPFWVRLMSLGMLGLWAFWLSPHLWTLLPFVAFGSLSWAASDLSVRSKIQESLPPELRGRAFGAMTAVTFALVLAASLGLGVLFDLFPVANVFLGVGIALTAVVGGLLYAAHRLQGSYGPKR